MPFYSFKCEKCNLIFSINMKMTELKINHLCPDCGSSSKRSWKNDKPVIIWKGPGGSSTHYNPNINEVEEEMYQEIVESEDE